MPQGLQVWDAGGSVVLDTSTSTGLATGSVITGTTAGSIVVQDFSLGAPFFFMTPYGSSRGTPALASISGNTLSWDFPPYFADRIPSRIVYGIR